VVRCILVPLDGSATAARGLHEAIGVAASRHAVLQVLHVVDPYVPDMGYAPAFAFEEGQAAMCRRGDDLLALACKDAATQGVAAEPALCIASQRSVAETIVEQAQRRGCELVVMGTHGRSGVRRVLIGSVAEAVARLSTTPVLLVPPAPAVEARYG